MTDPVILLPGMMCDTRLFGPQIKAFGSDRSVKVSNLSRADTMTDFAESVLSDAPQKFALGGLSMGGIVAMEIMRLAPDRVTKLALLDTNPLAEHEEVKKNRYPQMLAVREGRLADIMRDEMKPNYLADGPHRDEVLQLCMDMALDLGPHAFLRQSRALMDRRDQSDTLANVTVPTLILCGREDILCPVERHELMADMIPAACLEVVENAGHLPTIEQPDTTNSALARWLEA